jgi:hypothetical protein
LSITIPPLEDLKNVPLDVDTFMFGLSPLEENAAEKGARFGFVMAALVFVKRANIAELEIRSP